MKIRLFMVLLILVLGVFSGLVGSAPYASSSSFVYVASYWGSVDSPERVYPGSRDVVLIVEIVNNNPFRLESVYGNLSLPSGFSDINGYGYAISTGYVVNGSYVRWYVNRGEVFRFRFTISIDDWVVPKTYLASINISYTFYNISSNAIENGYYLLSGVRLVVSPFPSYTFDLIDVFWMAGGEQVYPTSPARNLDLHIKIRNLGSEDIDYLEAYLVVNPPFYPMENSYVVQSINAGGVFELIFQGVDIDAGYPSMVYYARLMLNYTFVGYGGARKDYSTIMSVGLEIRDNFYPSINLVSAEWVGGVRGYPGSRDISLSVALVNHGRFEVGNLFIEAFLPEGFTNQFGGQIINTSVGGVFGFGDFIRFTLDHIYISESVGAGVYYLELIVGGEGVIGNSMVMVSQNISVPIIVNSYSSNFSVVGVYWVYSGSPAIALPGSRDIILTIDLIYGGEDPIGGISPLLVGGEWFSLKDVSVDQETVTSGTRFTVAANLDINESVYPGIYPLTLKLIYLVDPQGRSIYQVSYINLSVVIYGGEIVSSRLGLVAKHWGVGQPIDVYPYSRDNPYYIEIVNFGPYNVEALYAYIILPDGFTSDSTNISIASTLGVGSFASGTFYIDVGGVEPGIYTANITVFYMVSIYGATIVYNQSFTVDLMVSKPPITGGYIELVDYGWLNDYSVYPGTSAAELVVRMANLAPYPVDAISIWTVDDGYISMAEDVHRVYVSGPIEPYGIFTVNIPLDISTEAEPGEYNLTLYIEYLLLSGGDGVRLSEVKTLYIRVESSLGVDFIFYVWQGESPGPGSVSILNLVFVNRLYSNMQGLYTTIWLPPGFISILNNGSVVNITPYIVTGITDISAIFGESLVAPGLPTTMVTSVSKGDYIVVSIPVRISTDVNIGDYRLETMFSFIDEWGVYRSFSLNVSFSIFGKPGVVEVDESRARLILGERVSNVSIVIRNSGSGAIYDIYLSIFGLGQVVAFSSAVKYIPVLYPGEEATVSWRASVNPEAGILGGVPAVVSMTYVDPIGGRRSINQTIILYIEGIPRLKLVDILVSPSPAYVNSTVSVSATLVNVGDATARNVEVELVGSGVSLTSGSYSFLGDIDEGTQIPFTVYFKTGDNPGSIVVALRVRYYNIFNEEITLEKQIRLDVLQAPVREEGGVGVIEFILEDVWRLYSVIVTAIFILISLMLVYRTIRISRRIQGEAG